MPQKGTVQICRMCDCALEKQQDNVFTQKTNNLYFQKPDVKVVYITGTK